MEMQSVKTRLAALGAGSMLAVAMLWLVYTWPTTVQYFPSYAVTYSKGLGQSFELEVVNETGHPVHFCATLYGWLPNGSFIEIGKKCGRGRVRLDPAPLRKYAKAWEGFKGVEPGVVVLLTYVNGSDAAGKPNLARAAKSFTIQHERVLQGEDIKATVKVRGRPPKEEPRQQDTKLSLSSQWPPRDITEQCIYDPSVPAFYCYEWRLDTVYYSAVDTKVPAVAARVVNTTHAYYINSIILRFSIDATTSTAVYFSGSAAISGLGFSVSFSQDIYTLVLSRSTIINSTDAWSLGGFFPRIEGVGVYVVGFYGDIAVARYKEYAVTYTPYAYESETGYVADMYLLRPSAARMQRGVLALFQDKDPGPTDNYGYSQIFNTLTNYWKFNDRRDDRWVGVSSPSMIDEIGGAPTLSIGIPLLIRLPVNPNLEASIGSQTASYAFATVDAALVVDYLSHFDIYARYYYPDAMFEYYGRHYRIPSIFVDVFVLPQ